MPEKGETFGQLKILDWQGLTGDGEDLYLCRCSCGLLSVAGAKTLINGNAVCRVCADAGVTDGRNHGLPVQEEDRRLCIYVAGAYSDNDVIPILDNMRRGMQACYQLIQIGPYAPWCPWMDYHYSLIGPMTKDQYYSVGLAWLRKADAVYVLVGWENSKGTKAEINLARDLGIPVFFVEADMAKWANEVLYEAA